MSSAVAELDSYLQSMLNLKPPGVSGSKIQAITTLCTANVSSESVLIQKIYTHFKKAPGTHKLGVLYVVDSVTRQWVDQARKAGQTPGPGASDGTFAAGVNRVTELLPVLMNDITSSAPEDQKARIRKLLDIWERGNTFPAAMLATMKEKLDTSTNNASTTPEKSPVPGFMPLGQQAPTPASQPAPAQNTAAILAALSNMAKQNTSAPATSGLPAQSSMNNVLGTQSTTPQIPSSTVDRTPQPNGQNVNPLGALLAGLSNGTQNQGQAAPPPLPTNVPQNPLAALFPQAQGQAQVPPPSMGIDPQQLQLLQLLQSQGIPQDQWGTALQLLNLTNANAPRPNVGGLPGFPPPPAQNAWGGRTEPPRDDYVRSPPYRRRSRSPGWDRRREPSPPRRRDSPVYGEYRGTSPGRNGDRDRGRRDYRQRSPAGRRGGRRSVTPPKETSLPPPGPKYVEFDYSLGPGMIKVLSRTLFVGGVTTSEAHLRNIFSSFGIVQTCIVNIDKRHAFVKMINRQDAVNARDGMESYKNGEMQLRVGDPKVLQELATNKRLQTRWGVGFGPRDCSDYQTGISVIPIDRLTDADRKWMLTAEYGGTGGRPIEPGMVVEEPDIEIGAGVSSKAISRRMATDSGGKRGPQSSRENREREQQGFRQNDNSRSGSYGRNNGDYDNRNDNRNSNGTNIGGVPPPVPGFGFNFSGMPNMPMFPPGFLNAGAGQPPPPGQ